MIRFRTTAAPPTTPAWAGAVLTGGRSSRMGRDKALLEVDGQAMAVRAARALAAAGAAEVRCIGGDAPALAALGLRVGADLHPDAGPLGGVLSALAGSSHPMVVVLACDIVRPDPAAIASVVAALAASPASVLAAAPEVAGVVQSLHAAYRASAQEPLEAAFEAGERALHRALAGLQVLRITDIAPEAVADADTPEEL